LIRGLVLGLVKGRNWYLNFSEASFILYKKN